MIFLLLFAGILTTAWLRRKRRELIAAGQTQRLAYSLLKSAVPCAFTFTLVAGFYSALSVAALWQGQNFVTLDRLYAFERWLTTVRTVAASIKPSGTASLLMLAGLFALALLGVALAERSPRSAATLRNVSDALSKILSPYSRVVGTSMAVLTLLSSFSFLGPQLDPARGRLELRTKGVEEESVKQAAGLVEAVREQVDIEIVEIFVDEAPEQFHDWLEAERLLHEELERQAELRRRATEVGAGPFPAPAAESAFERMDLGLERLLDRQRPNRRGQAPQIARRALAEISNETRQTGELERQAEGRQRAGERVGPEPAGQPERSPQERPSKAHRTPTKVSVEIEGNAVSLEKLKQLGRWIDNLRPEWRKLTLSALTLERRRPLTRATVKALVRQLGISKLAEIHPLLSPLAKIANDGLASVVERMGERRVIEPVIRRLSPAALGESEQAFRAELRSEARELIRREARPPERWAPYVETARAHAARASADLEQVRARGDEYRAEVRRAEAELGRRRSELLRQVRRSFERLADGLPSRREAIASRSASQRRLSSGPMTVEDVLQELQRNRRLLEATGTRYRPFDRYGGPQDARQYWREDAGAFLERLASSFESERVTRAEVLELERLAKLAEPLPSSAQRQFELVHELGSKRAGVPSVSPLSLAEVVAQYRAAQEFRRMARTRGTRPYGPRRPYRPRPRAVRP